MSKLFCLNLIMVFLGLGFYCLRLRIKGSLCQAPEKLTGKVAIITGANSGIGRENVLDFLKRGAKVYMGCRNLTKAKNVRKSILLQTSVDEDQLHILHLDLSSLISVIDFAQEFSRRETQLHLLINNAGVMGIPYQLSNEGYELTFATNHLGHFALTNLLEGKLRHAAPSRVVTVSSMVHRDVRFSLKDVNQPNLTQWHHYKSSKLMNILFTKELAKRFQGTGVTTYAVHPGCVATELQQHYLRWCHYFPLRHLLQFVMDCLFRTPYEGAQTQICVAVSSALSKDTGRFYNDNVEEAPSAEAQHAQHATDLWHASVKMIKPFISGRWHIM